MKLSRFGCAVLAVLLTAGAARDLAAENSCISCHSRAEFYTQQPALYRYYQDWIQSTHSEAGLTCDDCHGGDPAAATKEQAHRGIYPPSDEKSSLHLTRQPATCGACHSENQQQFEESKHYRALMSEQGSAPTCTTCHPAMHDRPGYHSIVLESCTTCHHKGNPQGLPPVADAAETLLRHINMASGLLGWSALHFESLGWPDDSRERVTQLTRRHSDIVSRVHRFDLEASEQAVKVLLDDLQREFDAAKKSPRGKAAAVD